MTHEEWRPIEGLGGVAEVSNYGAVRTLERECVRRYPDGVVRTSIMPEKELTIHVTRYGYAEVCFRINGTIHRHRVHRLVASAFVDGEFEGAEVDHLDGDKLNNLATNLQWVTKSENVKRAWSQGLNRGTPTKLTDLQMHAVKVLYDHNFPPSMIAEWFGISTSLAYQVGAGKAHAAKLQSRKKPIPVD